MSSALSPVLFLTFCCFYSVTVVLMPFQVFYLGLVWLISVTQVTVHCLSSWDLNRVIIFNLLKQPTLLFLAENHPEKQF